MTKIIMLIHLAMLCYRLGWLHVGLYHCLLYRCCYCDWSSVGIVNETRVAYLKAGSIISLLYSAGTADKITEPFPDNRH